MKKTLLPVLIALVSTAFAQDPGEPCCNVIGVNTTNNTVIARNNITGRLFAFKVDAMDIKAVKVKDAVTADAGMNVVTAVNGAVRKYNAEPVNHTKLNYAEPVNAIKKTTAEPVNAGKISLDPVNGIVQINWQEPCCAIVQIDNLEPCCNVVTAKNKTTGATIKFKAPALVLGSVKVGDPVYAEPCCNMAIVQSSYQGNGGQLNSFGYPIEGSSGNEENASAKWVITTANMKGVLGRLNTAFPSDVEWSVDIRASADNKFITNRSGFSKHGPAQDIAPGMYNFQLNTILVENVPIERGKETRLKTGVLQIVSEGDWEIRNETKEKFHTSGNKPKKIALPVGSYQLVLGGQFFPVVIKDGATVEY
jgi:hypothetical protein